MLSNEQGLSPKFMSPLVHLSIAAAVDLMDLQFLGPNFLVSQEERRGDRRGSARQVRGGARMGWCAQPTD